MRQACPLLVSMVFLGVACARSEAADQSLLEHLVDMWSIPSQQELAQNPLRSVLPVRIFRFELDVTADGIPELFLGSTWGGSRQGVPWVVYRVESDGRYRPLGTATFGFDTFLYKPEDSTLFALRSPGQGQWGCTYFHIGEDGIRELTGEVVGEPPEDEARMLAWAAEGERPHMSVANLTELGAGTPEWRDSVTKEVNPSLGPLDDLVTESGACSAEKFLDSYREAGCTPIDSPLVSP
jgi:hypothetical protein